MKSVNWMVCLGIAAALVFGVTFAANFLPAWRKAAPKAAAPQARLSFVDAVTDFPPVAGPEKPRPAECEIGHSQSHDFWFKNENAQDLRVGVYFKTCQCTSVLLWLAPKDWKTAPNPDDREKAAKEVEQAAQGKELKNVGEETVGVVPAGAVGFVRLTWTGDRPGPKSLAADLWMGEKGAGPNQHFEIRCTFIPPLKAPSEIPVGDWALADLPQTVEIPCWSSTRADFPLNADVLNSRWKEESNPMVLGKPVRMSEAELNRLRADPSKGAVLAGYKVTLTLNRTSADGKTALDLGPFRRRIRLATDGGELVVGVFGSVRGDLAPAEADSVPVNFHKFDASAANVEWPVVLGSAADVQRLELDRERTPDFLDVEFADGPTFLAGRKNWKLVVKWAPASHSSGVFPRDEEGYRDSAVYIRPVYAKDGTSPPCLRIPVIGIADSQ